MIGVKEIHSCPPKGASWLSNNK